MSPERRYGMDHDHYQWSPIVARERIRWPNEARVAFCAIVNLEYLEPHIPPGSYHIANLYSHYAMQRPLPELWSISYREYGHRIGIFRVLDVLERYGIRCTIAVDSETVKNRPYLIEHCMRRNCEFIAHGVSAARMITSQMPVDEERSYIQESIETLKAAIGVKPDGWIGPDYGESTRTPELLTAAGITYVCDWANDEQPYRMTTPEGALYALPILGELDDVFALRDRRFPIDDYAQQLKDAADVIYADAEQSGRLFVLNLHPWLVGQAFRIRYLEEAIGHIMRRQGIWPARGSEIIECYRAQMAERD